MYRDNWVRALLSRAVAVAVLCLAIAWLGGKLGEAERDLTSKMSHEELKAYMREGTEASFGERYLTSLIAAAVFVVLAEGMAGVLRVALPAAPGAGVAPHTGGRHGH